MCPSVKRRFSIQIHTHHTQGACMWWRQRSGWCIHKPRISKGHQQLLEAGWGVGRGPEQTPSMPLKRNHHLALRCSASRTVRQYIPIGLIHPVCSTLLEQPQLTNTKSMAFWKMSSFNLKSRGVWCLGFAMKHWMWTDRQDGFLWSFKLWAQGVSHPWGQFCSEPKEGIRKAQAAFLHLFTAQDGSPLHTTHYLPKNRSRGWRCCLGRCQPQSHTQTVHSMKASSQPDLLCESWGKPGVGNAGFEGSHISPEVAGGPLLEKPSNKPTLHARLCTHSGGHAHHVLATTRALKPTSLTGPLPTYCLTPPREVLPAPHLTLNGPGERNTGCLGTQGRVPGAWGVHERKSECGAEAAAHWDLASSSSVVQVIHIHLSRFPWGMGTF